MLGGSYSRCFVVCPKESSYALKDMQTRDLMKEIFSKWISAIREVGCPCIYGFAEDVLFREWDTEHKSLYVTGDADFKLIVSNLVEYFGSDYAFVSDRETIQEAIVMSSIRKVKPPDRRKCFDADEYWTKRYNTIHQRIRFACNTFLESEPFVLYFNAKGGTFCNSVISGSELGDGKIRIDVDLYSGRTEIKYSGININESELFTILGGLFNGKRDN